MAFLSCIDNVSTYLETCDALANDSDLPWILFVEEVPKEHEERHQADLVTNQQLGADRPPEECKVRRVSRASVDARGNKLMAVLLNPLRRVVEVGSSSCHGEGSTGLTKDHHEETDGNRVGVDVALLIGWENPV